MYSVPEWLRRAVWSAEGLQLFSPHISEVKPSLMRAKFSGSFCASSWMGSMAAHGRPQEFFQRGTKPRGLRKMTYFSARRRPERKCSRFFQRFRLNLRVFDASAEGASENFRVSTTGTAYDVIIFKFQGGATAPGCPPSGRLCGRRLTATVVITLCPVTMQLFTLVTH